MSADPKEISVEALEDGDAIAPKEIALRITARYRAFGLYETAMLGMLAQSTGWATAARECVAVAAPLPVISFGARHVHPDITDVLDYAAIVGGCVGASTPAGARLAGLSPTGTMPHSLVLIIGDTVKAAEAFDRDLEPDVPRIVLVDTFKDEAEESLRVAHALGDRLYGIRLDTPSERGRVTPDLVREVRARLDQAGFGHVKIVASGGLTPERIQVFKDAGAPVDSYAVGRTSAGRRRSTSPAISRRSTAARSRSAAGSRSDRQPAPQARPPRGLARGLKADRDSQLSRDAPSFAMNGPISRPRRRTGRPRPRSVPRAEPVPVRNAPGRRLAADQREQSTSSKASCCSG